MRYRNEVGGQSKTPNKPPDTAPVFRASGMAGPKSRHFWG